MEGRGRGVGRGQKVAAQAGAEVVDFFSVGGAGGAAHERLILGGVAALASGRRDGCEPLAVALDAAVNILLIGGVELLGAGDGLLKVGGEFFLMAQDVQEVAERQHREENDDGEERTRHGLPHQAHAAPARGFGPAQPQHHEDGDGQEAEGGDDGDKEGALGPIDHAEEGHESIGHQDDDRKHEGKTECGLFHNGKLT